MDETNNNSIGGIDELDLDISVINENELEKAVGKPVDEGNTAGNTTGNNKGSGENLQPETSSTGEDTTAITENTSTTDTQVEEGMTVIIDEVECTVNANGEAVDANGVVVKTKGELAALVASAQTTEPSVLETLQTRFGTDFKDENGNTIVFEDTPEGLASYVDTVLKNNVEQTKGAVIDSLFKTYPVLEQVYTHIKLNGSLDNFNVIPDRNGVTIDKDSEEQQIAVIKEEWELQGKKGNVKGYIDYLKAAGILYDTAVESNKTVAEIYDARRAEKEAELAEQEAAEKSRIDSYWKQVDEVVAKGEILGYKIPDNIQKTVDGKTVIVSKDDFKRYINSPVDAEGNTAYMLDEAKVDDNTRMQDDLLRAYLRFTGGNYSSLVGMAVNKEKVLKLKTQSQQATTKRTLVLNSNSNNTKSVNNDDLILG